MSKRKSPAGDRAAAMVSTGNDVDVSIVAHPQIADNIAYAIAYARRGIAVIPLHTPLFDHPAGWRCSCEEYRHNEKYRGRAYFLEPWEHCATPGKHPRLSGAWEGQATTDEEIIRRWWRRWPDANIGIACGPSGLLVLDRDAYKDAYEGDSLDIDEETVTVLTGGGGTHLWYRQRPGDRFGNHNGTLPPGMDIRGYGGLVVAPPSLHSSGRRYEFEVDYGPADVEIAEIPPPLRRLLEKHNARQKRPARRMEIQARPVDVARFRLPVRILEMIGEPGVRGTRSERDMSIVVALVYAGATDEEIAGIFAHEPCGAKFRERGMSYLAHTIANARDYCASNPRADARTIAALRAWAQTTSFAPFIPEELRCASGYRTDATDTRVVDAILDICEEHGALRVRAALREIARRAGVGGPETVRRALARLAAIVHRDEDGWLTIAPDVVETALAGAGVAFEEYTRRKSGDAFISGRAKRASGDERPLGETALRALAALAEHGPGDRRDLADWTGKSRHSLGRTMRALEALGLVDVERGDRGRKIYEIAGGAWERIEEITRDMRTYTLAIERAQRLEEQAQNWTIEQLRRATEPDEIRRLERRLQRSKALRYGLMALLEPDWTDEALTAWVEAENARAMPSAAAYDYRRTEQAAAMVERIGHRLRLQGWLTQKELAELRSDAGRLGVDIAEFVDEADGIIFSGGATQ